MSELVLSPVLSPQQERGKQQQQVEGTTRLTDLPDELVCHILSFLSDPMDLISCSLVCQVDAFLGVCGGGGGSSGGASCSRLCVVSREALGVREQRLIYRSLSVVCCVRRRAVCSGG